MSNVNISLISYETSMTAKEKGKTSAQIVDELLKELQSKSYVDSSPTSPIDKGDGGEHKAVPEPQEKAPSDRTESSRTSKHKRKKHLRSHSTDGESSDNNGREHHKLKRHKHKKKKKKSSGHDNDSEHRCKSSRKRRHHKDKDLGGESGNISNGGDVWNIFQTRSSDEVEWESDTSWSTKQKLLSSHKKNEPKEDVVTGNETSTVHSLVNQSDPTSLVISKDTHHKEQETVVIDSASIVDASQTLDKCDSTAMDSKDIVVPNVMETPTTAGSTFPAVEKNASPTFLEKNFNCLTNSMQNAEVEAAPDDGSFTFPCVESFPATSSTSFDTAKQTEKKQDITTELPSSSSTQSDTGYLLGVLVGAREQMSLLPPVKKFKVSEEVPPLEKRESLTLTDFWKVRRSPHLIKEGKSCDKKAVKTSPSQEEHAADTCGRQITTLQSTSSIAASGIEVSACEKSSEKQESLFHLTPSLKCIVTKVTEHKTAVTEESKVSVSHPGATVLSSGSVAALEMDFYSSSIGGPIATFEEKKRICGPHILSVEGKGIKSSSDIEESVPDSQQSVSQIAVTRCEERYCSAMQVSNPEQQEEVVPPILVASDVDIKTGIVNMHQLSVPLVDYDDDVEVTEPTETVLNVAEIGKQTGTWSTADTEFPIQALVDGSEAANDKEPTLAPVSKLVYVYDAGATENLSHTEIANINVIASASSCLEGETTATADNVPVVFPGESNEFDAGLAVGHGTQSEVSVDDTSASLPTVLVEQSVIIQEPSSLADMEEVIYVTVQQDEDSFQFLALPNVDEEKSISVADESVDLEIPVIRGSSSHSVSSESPENVEQMHQCPEASATVVSVKVPSVEGQTDRGSLLQSVDDQLKNAKILGAHPSATISSVSLAECQEPLELYGKTVSLPYTKSFDGKPLDIKFYLPSPQLTETCATADVTESLPGKLPNPFRSLLRTSNKAATTSLTPHSKTEVTESVQDLVSSRQPGIVNCFDNKELLENDQIPIHRKNGSDKEMSSPDLDVELANSSLASAHLDEKLSSASCNDPFLNNTYGLLPSNNNETRKYTDRVNAVPNPSCLITPCDNFVASVEAEMKSLHSEVSDKSSQEIAPLSSSEASSGLPEKECTVAKRLACSPLCDDGMSETLQEYDNAKSAAAFKLPEAASRSEPHKLLREEMQLSDCESKIPMPDVSMQIALQSEMGHLQLANVVATSDCMKPKDAARELEVDSDRMEIPNILSPNSCVSATSKSAGLSPLHAVSVQSSCKHDSTFPTMSAKDNALINTSCNVLASAGIDNQVASASVPKMSIATTTLLAHGTASTDGEKLVHSIPLLNCPSNLVAASLCNETALSGLRVSITSLASTAFSSSDKQKSSCTIYSASESPLTSVASTTFKMPVSSRIEIAVPTEEANDAPPPYEMQTEPSLPFIVPTEMQSATEVFSDSLQQTLPSQMLSVVSLPLDIPLPPKVQPTVETPFEVSVAPKVPAEIPLPAEAPLEIPLPSKVFRGIPILPDAPLGIPLPPEMPPEIPLPPEEPPKFPLPPPDSPPKIPLPPESPPKIPLPPKALPEIQLLPEAPPEIPLPTVVPPENSLPFEAPLQIPLPPEAPPEIPLPPDEPPNILLPLEEVPEFSLPPETPPEIPLPPETPPEIPLPPETPAEITSLPSEILTSAPEMPTEIPLPLEVYIATEMLIDMSIGTKIPSERHAGSAKPLAKTHFPMSLSSSDVYSSPSSSLFDIPLPTFTAKSIASPTTHSTSVESVIAVSSTLHRKDSLASKSDVFPLQQISDNFQPVPTLCNAKTLAPKPLSVNYKDEIRKTFTQPSACEASPTHGPREPIEVHSPTFGTSYSMQHALNKGAWKLFPCMPSVNKSLFSVPVKKDSSSPKAPDSEPSSPIPLVALEQAERLAMKERLSPIRSPSPELTPEQLLIEKELRERLLRSALHITSSYKGMLPPSKLAEVAALLATNKSAEAAALMRPTRATQSIEVATVASSFNKRDGEPLLLTDAANRTYPEEPVTASAALTHASSKLVHQTGPSVELEHRPSLQSFCGNIEALSSFNRDSASIPGASILTAELDRFGADDKVHLSAPSSESSKAALSRLNAFSQSMAGKPVPPQPLHSIISDSKKKKLTILMPDKLPTKQASKVSRWGPKSTEPEAPVPAPTKIAQSTWAAMVSQQKSLQKETATSRFTPKLLDASIAGSSPSVFPDSISHYPNVSPELHSTSTSSDTASGSHPKTSLQDKLRKLAQYPEFAEPEKAIVAKSSVRHTSSSVNDKPRHMSRFSDFRLPVASVINALPEKAIHVPKEPPENQSERSRHKKPTNHMASNSCATKSVSEAATSATTVQEKLRLLAAYPETSATIIADATEGKPKMLLKDSSASRPVADDARKNEEESSAREEGELSPHSKESGASSAEEVDEYIIRPNVKRKRNRSRHRSRRRKKKKRSSSQKKNERSRKSNSTSRHSQSCSPSSSKKPKGSHSRKSVSPSKASSPKKDVCAPTSETSVKVDTVALPAELHSVAANSRMELTVSSAQHPVLGEVQTLAQVPLTAALSVTRDKSESRMCSNNSDQILVDKTEPSGETKETLHDDDNDENAKVEVDPDDEKRRKKEKKEQRKREKEQEKERKREKKEMEKERKREKKEEKERKKDKDKLKDQTKKRSHSRGRSHSKDRDRSQDRDRARRQDRSKDRSRSRDRQRSTERDGERKKDLGKSHEVDNSKDRDRSKGREVGRSRGRDRSKERSDKGRNSSKDRNDKVRSNRSRDRDQRHSSRERTARDRSSDRDHRDRNSIRNHSKERGQSKDRAHSKERDRRGHRWRSRSRSLSRRRSRTRSRSRSRDRWRTSPRHSRVTDLREKIDKAKLLEIARKNAIAMISQGRLPPGVKVDSLKQEQVVAIKAGGKSVAELTDFCKLLVKKEGEDSSDSGGERQGAASDDEGDGPFIQHPFKLRDSQPNIVMKIRNATQLPVKTSAEKAVDCSKLRIQFPVSSGSHHRVKESEWVPVSPPKAPAASTPAVPTAPVAAKPEETVVVVIAPADKVFNDPPAQPVVDIGSIVSARLRAVRKLQENPNDVEALTLVHHAQQQMQNWAESKQLPGQFTGTANARMLTPEELAGPSHLQAWVKKDQFNRAAPIDGGMGMYLLRKMGWNPGEGLGKNKEGVTEPLVLDIKMDKKGLTSADESVKKLQVHPVSKDLSGKHPVSALVELCSKRRWGPPEFTLVHDSGPDHKKNFLFKVKVNGKEYQPAVASPNKKLAKAQSASICLQQFGLVPTAKELSQNVAK